MKKYLFVLMLMTAALLPRGGRAQANGAAVLANIQRRLTWRTPIDSVQQLAGALDQLRAQKSNSYLSYWGAFAQYHLYFCHGKDKQRAEAALIKGIDLRAAMFMQPDFAVPVGWGGLDPVAAAARHGD